MLLKAGVPFDRIDSLPEWEAISYLEALAEANGKKTKQVDGNTKVYRSARKRGNQS